MPAAALGGKERIEAHHARNLGQGELQAVRDHALHLQRQIAVDALSHVQHLNQRPFAAAVFARQLADARKKRLLVLPETIA